MAHARLLFWLGALALVAGCSESHGVVDHPDVGGADDAWVALPDGGTDAWAALDGNGFFDAGTRPCTADDAHEEICPTAICDGLDSYAWDGERCIRIDCGTCIGADCAHLEHTQAACEAAHSTCIPEMCRATGGDWLFWAQECLPYHCGNPQPSECLVGMPVCNCGDHRSFDPTRGGCFDDASCPVVDPLPPMQLCTATGGEWMTGICCPTRCGQFCEAACAADACACGPLQIFDAVHGCVDADECHVHDAGQICSDAIRCQDGLLCCQHCGGTGCDPTTTCTVPVCDTDPHTDTCGNNLLAP